MILNWPKVYFYLPVNVPPDVANSIDRVAEWQRADRGKYNIGACHWTLQTYSHLKAGGFACELVQEIPKSGIIIAHRDNLPTGVKPGASQLLVCLQVDRSPHPFAQLSILHNPCDRRAKTAGLFYMPPWPQVGMKARSQERGDIFDNVAYFGWEGNLASELRDPSWLKQLRRLGLNFMIITESSKGDWDDYTEVDAIVAVRSFSKTDYYEKPALKLFNAWHAGVPAVLGVESSYRAERKSDLDYVEVTSPDETLTALKRLRDDSRLRHAMINNGRMRAGETRSEAIAARWVDFLHSRAVPAYERWCNSSWVSKRAYFIRRALSNEPRQRRAVHWNHVESSV